MGIVQELISRGLPKKRLQVGQRKSRKRIPGALFNPDNIQNKAYQKKYTTVFTS